MEEGYSMCMNKWVLDKSIKNELNILLIISSLCAEKGYCYASNKYLADLFNITEISVSSKIGKLEKKGYITIDYKKRGCEVISREIRLKNFLIDGYKNFYSTVKKNFKGNNISIENNKKDNNINIIIEKRFQKPTIEQIEQYCKERCNDVDAERFYNFYESKGWMIGKNKMKDWKAAVRTWEKQSKKEEKLPVWFNQDLKKEEDDELDKLAEQLTRGTWKP